MEACRLQWQAEQDQLCLLMCPVDDVDWALDAKDAGSQALSLVGGVDISFADQPKTNASGTHTTDRAVAAIVVMTFPDLKLVFEAYEEVVLDVPYMPGFLAFRECPSYLRLVRQAQQAGWMPEVLLVDGCGVLHPRRFGSACHLGVLSGIPTVGVAKKLMEVDGLDRRHIRRHLQNSAAGSAVLPHPTALVPAMAKLHDSSVAVTTGTVSALATAMLPVAIANEDVIKCPAAALSSVAPETTSGSRSSYSKDAGAVPRPAISNAATTQGLLLQLQATPMPAPPTSTSPQRVRAHDCMTLNTARAGAAAPAGKAAASSVSAGCASATAHAATRTLPLVGQSGAVLGMAVCCGATTNPVFVSVGM